jgi:hypothetical protein
MLGGAGARALASRVTKHGIRNRVSEWYLFSGKKYQDPFNEIELDVVFTGPKGDQWRVPAYWAGDHTWAVRFAAPDIGHYEYETECSDAANEGLHKIKGSLEVEPYDGRNLLYRRGGLRVAADQRHFVHADGTPFFWLADTWWGGLVQRLRWPEDFQLLTADRVMKGFTVIQIAAAFLPIMGPFDLRSANEAGFPWEKEFARINPAYFDMADLRIQHLVERGLTPCIFGGWGYTILMTGVPKMKQHWRNLVARWGAYPVVWCLCGEVDMPWFHSADRARETEEQIRGWVEVGHYLRRIDPYHRLVTVHPLVRVCSGRAAINEAPVLDFDMLQTNHEMGRSIVRTVETVRASAAKENPRLPVLNGEVSYEGVFGDSPASHQRFLFWASILSGAVAGHTYGAAGIWEVNTETVKAGQAPRGENWGETPWSEAYRLPGSGQLRYSKELLMSFPWWRLESHQEWVDRPWNGAPAPGVFAAGIPGELRIIYTPALRPWATVKKLERDVVYRGFFFNPANGKRYDLISVVPDGNGDWKIPEPPLIQDWVVVLQARDYEKHPDLA